MQTLGLSDSTPRSESRLRALFWPSIRNAADLDYVTRQGFWVCFTVAVVTIVFSLLLRSFLLGLFESSFFFLAGVGVRERSRTAAFSAYLLGTFTVGGFSVVRILFLALLFSNVRGNWLAASWKSDAAVAPVKLNQTWTDGLVDCLPSLIWPKARPIFYVLACCEILLLFYVLFAPSVR